MAQEKGNTVKISEFKAKCIGILKELKKNGGEPLTITSRGEPIAVVYPPQPKRTKPIFGGQPGTVTILGDIVNFNCADDWEALKD